MSDRTLKKPGTESGGPPAVLGTGLRRLDGVRLRVWLVGLAILLAVFSRSLVELVRFAFGSELYSYIVLIPFVTAYLVGSRIRDISPEDRPSWFGAGGFWMVGLIFFGFAHFQARPAASLPLPDSLGLSTASFLACFIGTLFVFPGIRFIKRNAFALTFLVFLIPFPSRVEHGIEVFFQMASAEMAALFLAWANVPMLRDGVIFRLPGIGAAILIANSSLP